MQLHKALFPYFLGLALCLSFPTFAQETETEISETIDKATTITGVGNIVPSAGTTITSTGTLTVGDSNKQTAGSLKNDNTINNSGAFNVDVGDFSNNGIFNSNTKTNVHTGGLFNNFGTINNNLGEFTISSSGNFNNAGTFVNNANLSISGTFSNNFTTASYNGNGNIFLNGTIDQQGITSTANLFISNGTFTIGGNLTATQYYSISLSGPSSTELGTMINDGSISLSKNETSMPIVSISDYGLLTNNGTMDSFVDINIRSSATSSAILDTTSTGTLNNSGNIHIEGSGALVKVEGKLANYGEISTTNQGGIKISEGGILTNYSSIQNSGIIDINYGSLNLTNTQDGGTVPTLTNESGSGIINLEGISANEKSTINIAGGIAFNNFGTMNLKNEFSSVNFESGSTLDLSSTGVINNSSGGELKLNAGSILSIALGDIATSAPNGQIVGDLIISGITETNKVILNPIFEENFSGGAYKIVDGTITTDGANPFYYVNKNYVFSWSDDLTIFNIRLKTSEEKAEEIIAAGGTSDTVNLSNAYIDTPDVTNSTGLELQNKLRNLYETDTTAMVKVANALLPKRVAQTNTATNIATQTMSIVSGFMSSGLNTRTSSFASTSRNYRGNRRSRMSPVGLNSGDPIYYGMNLWIQGLYNKAEYTKGYGFDSKTWGYAAGLDYKYSKELTFGIGYTYSDTDITSLTTKTGADTHTGFIYAEYKPSNWFINGILSYGYGKYSDANDISGIKVGADYTISTYGAQAMLGYKSKVITPMAGLRYFYMDQEGYTDSAGQSINRKYSSSLTGILGVKFAKTYRNRKGVSLTPELKVAATYDLITPKNEINVSLTNGVGYRVTGEELNKFGFEVGAGVSTTKGPVEFAARYEGKFKSKYSDHTGVLEFRYNF